jgi:hypothetical protein
MKAESSPISTLIFPFAAAFSLLAINISPVSPVRP